MQPANTAILIIAGVAVLGVGYLLWTNSQNKTNAPPSGYYPPVGPYPPATNTGTTSEDHTREDWETGVAVGQSVINTGLAIADKFGAFD